MLVATEISLRIIFFSLHSTIELKLTWGCKVKKKTLLLDRGIVLLLVRVHLMRLVRLKI